MSKGGKFWTFTCPVDSVAFEYRPTSHIVFGLVEDLPVPQPVWLRCPNGHLREFTLRAEDARDA
jgi:hypothetical protein